MHNRVKIEYPVLVGTLVALLALSAKIGHAQAAQTATPDAATHRVAVATRTIARGTVLAAGDFVLRDTTLRGPSDTTTVGEGWVARRLIGSGEILRMPAVERPRMINANQAVQLEWSDSNVTLVLRGIATRNAALGDRIAVRTDSGRRVEATVVAPGRLRLQ
jgi:flagella basal body P-ring formation protein FlgA